MKVAYLFLVYGDINHPQLWEQYFSEARSDQYLICCHPADRDATKTPFLKDNTIPFWVSTGWGTLGLVIAQIELLRFALRDPDAQRFCLCSGTCVPIKRFQTTYDLLFAEDKSWMSMFHKFLSRTAKVTHIPPEHHMKNSQWVMLNRKHAEYLVRFNFLSDFVHCIIPDEHYVGTVLTHLGEQENILQREQTAVHWTTITQVQMSPIEHETISDKWVRTWRESPSLFARKFKPNSNIAERWDEIVGA